MPRLGCSFQERGVEWKRSFTKISPRALGAPELSLSLAPTQIEFSPKAECELNLRFLLKSAPHFSVSLLPFHKYLDYSVLSLYPSFSWALRFSGRMFE